MKPIRILLIDDHALFRSGIAMVLGAALTDVAVAEVASLDEALKYEETPRLILLDLQMPGLSGLQGIPLLRQRWPEALLVVVSGMDAGEAAHRCESLGARAFISKAEPPQRVLELIGQLIGADVYPHSSETPALTPRQMQVLELLYRGLPNKSIGKQLGLSENTVRGHVQALLATLGVSSRSEAAFQARRLGLVE